MHIRLLSSLLLLMTASAAIAAEHDLAVVVNVEYQNRAQLQSIAARFEHPLVDRAARWVRLETTVEDAARLRRDGFAVTVDEAATAELRSIQSKLLTAAARMPDGAGTTSIPGFACYRTVEETYQTIADLVALRPDIAGVADIGPSWQKTQNPASGYEMKVLKLTNSATDAALPDKPTMVVFGSIHAREYAPAELVTRFAEWLVTGHGSDDEATWLLDNFSFHLILQGNPDGRKKAETGLLWRKNTNGSNGSCSANRIGTDLNRNFPFHWNTAPGGSSGNPCDETYRGPEPTSEPETQNLFRLVAGLPGSDGTYSGGLFPDRRGDAVNSLAPDDYQGIFFDIHSAAELVIWSWGDTSNDAPNGAALQALGRRLAYVNHYYPMQADELYVTDGTTDDTMYGLLGVPSYTIELGGTFFENCASFNGTTAPDNLAALRYAARNLYAPYRLPSGPDTTEIGVSSTSVPAGTPVTLTATVDDAVFSQANGTEPVQAIASATAYLDAPPWASGAAAIPLAASDGNFNSNREIVGSSIPTAALAAGVHTIYVQGTDASGKPGTPNAVRFTVTGSNVPPAANFRSVVSAMTASFTDLSSDSDGSIASYSWDFGDGTTSTSANPSKTYPGKGLYKVTLTVTDDDGGTASKMRRVKIGERLLGNQR
jgi:carboxypeptidase T